MITKVYAFHCGVPTEDCRQYVSDQFYYAHKYYNKLIELERKLHHDKKEFEKVCNPDLEQHYNAVSARELELSAALEQHTKSKVNAQDKLGSDELYTLVKTCRARLREAQKLLASERKKARATEQYKSALQTMNAFHIEARKKLYNNTPVLFWGTKNHCVQRVELAVSKRMEIGQPPMFQPWSRDGVLYAQVINGMDAASVFDCKHGVVQIETLPRDHRDSKRFGKRFPALVRMRVGSDGRKPIWCTVKASIHRKFPPGSRIMAVQLIRRQHMYYQHNDGLWHPYDDYEIQFTLRIPEEPRKYDPAKSLCAAIDLGWRVREDGLRVGLWADSDGNKGEFMLPAIEFEMKSRAERIQSYRDIDMNECLKSVIEWRSTLDAIPEWLEKAGIKNVHAWRSVSALYRLLSVMEDNKEFAPAMLEVLRKWRAREAHLQQYQRGLVWHQEARRLDYYRNLAAQFERKYNYVIFEDMLITDLRTDKEAEDETMSNDQIKNMRMYRNLSAIGLLRQCFVQKFGKPNVILGKTEFTTIDCHSCGTRNDFDKRRLVMKCTHCGIEIDQDYNAALNLLISERPRAEEMAAPVRPPEDGNGPDVAENGGKYVGRFAKRKQGRSKADPQAEAVIGDKL